MPAFLTLLGPLWTFLTSRVGLLVLAAGGIVLFYEGVPFLIDGRVDKAYTKGELHERADWNERMRLARIAEAADAKTRQQDIDAADQAYIDKQDADAGTIAALQEQLRLEGLKPDDPKAPRCRIATPRGVSERIDAIGR